MNKKICALFLIITFAFSVLQASPNGFDSFKSNVSDNELTMYVMGGTAVALVAVSVGSLLWQVFSPKEIDKPENKKLLTEKQNLLFSANTDWNSVNKDDYHSIRDYLSKYDTLVTDHNKKVQTNDSTVRKALEINPFPHGEEAWSALIPLLDKKVISYLQKTYPDIAQYVTSTIVYTSGQSSIKFYQFMRKPVVFKNPVSGIKVQYDITLVDDKMELTYDNNGVKSTFTFVPYKENLTLTGARSGLQINPDGWEYAYVLVANSFCKYPEYKYLDMELLDSVE